MNKFKKTIIAIAISALPLSNANATFVLNDWQQGLIFEAKRIMKEVYHQEKMVQILADMEQQIMIAISKKQNDNSIAANDIARTTQTEADLHNIKLAQDLKAAQSVCEIASAIADVADTSCDRNIVNSKLRSTMASGATSSRESIIRTPNINNNNMNLTGLSSDASNNESDINTETITIGSDWVKEYEFNNGLQNPDLIPYMRLLEIYTNEENDFISDNEYSEHPDIQDVRTLILDTPLYLMGENYSIPEEKLEMTLLYSSLIAPKHITKFPNNIEGSALARDLSIMEIRSQALSSIIQEIMIKNIENRVVLPGNEVSLKESMENSAATFMRINYNVDDNGDFGFKEEGGYSEAMKDTANILRMKVYYSFLEFEHNIKKEMYWSTELLKKIEGIEIRNFYDYMSGR